MGKLGVGWCGLGWAEDQIVIFNCDLNLKNYTPQMKIVSNLWNKESMKNY